MDLIKKYLDLAEAWPGTPEYKKKHDPSYNPYDPEGKMRKALKQQPYGYRGKAADGEEEETPSATPSVAKRGRPKKKVAEAVSQNPSAEKTYNYAFDKVRAMDTKNPFETSNKKSMYSRAARGAFQRMKTPSKKLTLPEEIEQLAELDKEPGGTLHRYLAKAGGPEGRQRRIKAAMDNPAKLKKINTGIKSAETKIEKERQKQTGMNPQYQRTPTAREIQMMDTRYTHEEYESMPASKALQKAHDDERKKRGLPDPDYYLKLAAQKKKEIEDMKKETQKEEVVTEMDKSQPSSSRGAEGLPVGKKVEPVKTDKVKSDALKVLQKQYKKVKEEVEQIDELKKSTLASYAKKASRDARIKTDIAGDFSTRKDRAKKLQNKVASERLADYYRERARKRETGVNKAIDRLAKEETEPPFKADKPKKPSALAGKYGAGYSTARHLARMGIKAALKDLKKGPEAGKKQVS